MRFAYCLIATASALDDSTMGLLSRAMMPDSEKRVSGFVELEPSGKKILRDQSHVPYSGLQLVDPSVAIAAKQPIAPVSPLRKHNHQKILVAKTTGKAAVALNAPATPDVYICSLPSGRNSLSGRNCDLVAPGSSAVLSQTLRCTSAIHPRTVADLLNGAQKAPIDFASTVDQTDADLASMDTPVGIEVSVGACSGARSDLPDLATDKNYVAFLMVNPDTVRAAELFASRGQDRQVTMRAGIVFADTRMLYEKNGVLKAQLASRFSNEVLTCADDGVCTSKELVQWAPTGDHHVDWFVGASETKVRFL